MTYVISAFPGMGKSTYFNQNPEDCLDSDSSQFSWVTVEGKKVRNPEFPVNYINHIKDNLEKEYKYIFVSSHKEVRDALIVGNVAFSVHTPAIDRKEEFIVNYRERGSSESFVQLISDNWSTWLQGIEDDFGNSRGQFMHFKYPRGFITDYMESLIEYWYS